MKSIWFLSTCYFDSTGTLNDPDLFHYVWTKPSYDLTISVRVTHTWIRFTMLSNLVWIAFRIFQSWLRLWNICLTKWLDAAFLISNVIMSVTRNISIPISLVAVIALNYTKFASSITALTFHSLIMNCLILRLVTLMRYLINPNSVLWIIHMNPIIYFSNIFQLLFLFINVLRHVPYLSLRNHMSIIFPTNQCYSMLITLI